MEEAPADLDLARREMEALKLVGLTRRAGRAVIGRKAVREAARRGSLYLALVARDAGDNARSRVVPVFDATGTTWLPCGSHAALGRSIGRDRVVVIGIADPRLATRIREVLERASGPECTMGSQQER